MFALDASRIIRSILRHPANRGHALRALTKSVGWQLTKRSRRHPISVDALGGPMLCWPDSEQSSNVIYYSGMPDFWEMSFLRAYLRAGDHAADVGGNIGVYTVLLSRCVGENGSVHCFEPDPATMQRLREQVVHAKLSNVLLHEIAVSDHTGTLSFSSGASSAMRHISRTDQQSDDRMSVGCTTLDAFLGWRKFEVMKLDIEGAEPLAFRGAHERLTNCPPDVLLFELSGLSKLYGFESERVIEMLEAYGYRTAVFEVSTNALRWTREPWRSGDTNLLSVHCLAHEKVSSRLAQRASSAITIAHSEAIR